MALREQFLARWNELVAAGDAHAARLQAPIARLAELLADVSDEGPGWVDVVCADPEGVAIACLTYTFVVEFERTAAGVTWMQFWDKPKGSEANFLGFRLDQIETVDETSPREVVLRLAGGGTVRIAHKGGYIYGAPVLRLGPSGY